MIEVPDRTIRYDTSPGAWGHRPLATLFDPRCRSHPDRESLARNPKGKVLKRELRRLVPQDSGMERAAQRVVG